jgi:hypothetical protein
MATSQHPRPGAEYLGDGLYASFDGFMIWVETERETGCHEIFFEQAEYHNLLSFVGKFWGITSHDGRRVRLSGTK